MKKKDIKDIINFAGIGSFMLATPFFGFMLSAAVALLVIAVNNVYYAFNNDEQYHYAAMNIQEPIDFEKELDKPTLTAMSATDWLNEGFKRDNDASQPGSLAYYLTHGHY